MIDESKSTHSDFGIVSFEQRPKVLNRDRAEVEKPGFGVVANLTPAVFEALNQQRDRVPRQEVYQQTGFGAANPAVPLVEGHQLPAERSQLQ